MEGVKSGGGGIKLLTCFFAQKNMVEFDVLDTGTIYGHKSAEGCCKGTGLEIEFKYFD